MQALTGVNVFISVSSTIFLQSGASITDALYASIGMGAVFPFVNIIAIPLVERLGRRVLVLTGSAMMTLCLIPATICYNSLDPKDPAVTYASLVAVFVFVASFSISFGPIAFLYINEVFPANVKGEAISWCCCSNWLSSFLICMIGGSIPNNVAFPLFMCK
jgi:MFS transporter, SP family, arabinose:H+ symporter